MAEPTTVFGLVQQGQDQFKQFAEQAFTQANTLLGDLTQFDVPNIDNDLSIEPPSIEISFEMPEAPTFEPESPDFPALPGDLQLPQVPAPQLPSAPGAFTESAPAVQSPQRPAPLSVSAPTNAPEVSAPEYPEAPDVALPDAPDIDVPLPSLREVQLPEFPEIVFPEFTAVSPDFNLQEPVVNIDFEEGTYSSPQLTALQATLQDMLNGMALPAGVEDALFERGRARLDRDARKQEMLATEQWSGRGFDAPGGDLAARLAEVRQGNQDAVSQLNRDVYIQSQVTAIENLRFAVGQMVTLESRLIGLFSEAAGRALEVQRITGQLAIDLFNARVTVLNARIAHYRAEADVFRTRVDAERAKLEALRAEIEAALAVNQLNELDVRIYAERVRAEQGRIAIYEARVRALANIVDVYEAQVRAALGKVEVDRVRMEGFRTRVEAYAQQVAGKRAEFEAYGEDVRAQSAATDAYRARVGAHAELTRAYATQVEASIAPIRAQVEINRGQVDAYTAKLGAFREKVNAEASRHQANVAVFDGKARIFSSQVSAASAEAQARGQEVSLLLEDARSRLQLLVENNRNEGQNAIQGAGLILEKLRSAATVASQLAAGAMSAVNLSAGISGSSSDSISRNQSLSVGYAVDGGEAAPPNISTF
ncbi:hypothetical protein JN531_003710 [Flagellatimonas centrodinii]|uniref:hypothetical protein n=1 Tax=Flagellatimonas centrodinii TaxID=2806210 RepID=UPI001FEF575C|nr:hypothetical protein [Flagellatimonas centrodinii]ULQ47393.1 hypothetical protein JN531_003710 [Flagellatimonas centrodinii]